MTKGNIQLYDTMTRSKRPFEPLEPGKVKMYACGPTVYGDPHIGNFRSFVSADLLRRWLEYRDLRRHHGHERHRHRRQDHPRLRQGR